jgi:hypothetical protein
MLVCRIQQPHPRTADKLLPLPSLCAGRRFRGTVPESPMHASLLPATRTYTAGSLEICTQPRQKQRSVKPKPEGFRIVVFRNTCDG